MSTEYKTKLLSVGDNLTYSGFGCRVCKVEPGFARIIRSDGQSTVVENPVPEDFCNAPQCKVPPLKDLMEQFHPWKEEFLKPITEHEKLQFTDDEKTVTLAAEMAVLVSRYKYAVCAAEEGFARLLRIDGQTKVVENPFKCKVLGLSEFKIILNANDSRRSELTSGITEQEKQECMKNQAKAKTKARGGLAAENAEMKSESVSAETAASPSQAKERKPREKKEGAKTFDGITDYIAGLVAEGKDNASVLEACRSKYPGCGKAWCNAVADRKRTKLAAKPEEPKTA